MSTHDAAWPSRRRGGPAILLAAVLLTAGSGDAAAQPARAVAPRVHDLPKLDGRDSDRVYGPARPVRLTGESGAEARAAHTGLDLWLHVGGLAAAKALPGGPALLVVRVDADRGRAVRPGDYEVAVAPDGELRLREGTEKGTFVESDLPAEDFAAAVAAGDDGSWSVELRIGLEWLGGYGRTDALAIALESEDGATLSSWPRGAKALAPSTWGELVLAPTVPAGAAAGSAFVDGGRSYLVVPYSPDLNPREITLEAWVRAVDGDCGTIFGNGRGESYWLAICESVRFSHGGSGAEHRGVGRLGEGWHHVAATMDKHGVRRLFVDGQAQARPGFESASNRERTAIAELGASRRPLRLGSDRSAPADRAGLHGYLREVRIWNRARSAEEIRKTAFESLYGDEPGLVALWPLTDGLADLAGGHHAGLVGNASLAREAPAVERFPPPLEVEPIEYRPREPRRPWRPHIPTADARISLDGECRAEEYEEAARLTLEPARELRVNLVLTPEGLALCAGPLLGSAAAGDRLVIWLSGEARGREPGPGDLRLTLSPDGKLAAETGCGGRFGCPAPAGVRGRAVGGARLAVQEDLAEIDAPWWSSEVFVSTAALEPFRPGRTLRLAVDYSGSAPARALPGLERRMTLEGRWPESFSKDDPGSWGEVPTGEADASAALGPTAAPPGAGGPSCRDNDSEREPVSSAIANHSHFGFLAPQHTAPARGDFYSRCPGSPGDTITPEGLTNRLSYALDKDAKWPLVHGTHPVVQASGVVQKVYVSPEDSPAIHTSHDFDLLIAPEPNYRWLSLHTDPDTGVTESGADTLKLETETLGLPPTGPGQPDARPSIGDHVTVIGRWIFDCGHEPKTEIHPLPFLAHDRDEIRPLWLGGPLRKVRTVRAWLNSDPRPFKYCFDGPIRFAVDLPEPGWMPFVRLIRGSRNQISWSRGQGVLNVTIDPPAETGTFFFELVAGHLIQPPDSETRAAEIHTVSFKEIEIFDDKDGFTKGSGEWYMAANVNGVWRQIFWDEEVDSGDTISLSDPRFTTADDDVTIQITAYEEDPLVDRGGEWVTPDPRTADIDGYPQGMVSSILGTRTLGSRRSSDWRLTYEVGRGGGTVASILHRLGANFWERRLADEPNDAEPVDLGELPVPAQGQSGLVTRYESHIVEQPLNFTDPEFGFTELFAADVDRYRFSVEDFAEIAVATPGAGSLLNVDVEQWNPWHWIGSLPPDVELRDGSRIPLEDAVGYAGAEVRVATNTGQSNGTSYTLSVTTSYKELVEDWGEDEDEAWEQSGQGARLVDLATLPPDPAAAPGLDVDPPTLWDPERRTLESQLAWQHAPGDLDHYEILLPPTDPQPGGHSPCVYDRPGRLIVRAHPMRVTAGAPLSDSGLGVVVVTDLASRFPAGGSVIVTVRHPDPAKRFFYTLSADWDNSRFYSRSECDELRRQHGLLETLAPDRMLELLKAVIAIHRDDLLGPRGPRPDPTPVELGELGDFRLVRLVEGDVLDIALASPETRPVGGRLFDGNGVLLGESVALDREARRGLPAPAGSVPQQRLTVGGLASTSGEATGLYLLQIVAVGAAEQRATGRVPVTVLDARGGGRDPGPP